MTKGQLFAVLFLSASLSACGGNDTREIDCEDNMRFQDRTVGKRVVALRVWISWTNTRKCRSPRQTLRHRRWRRGSVMICRR